MNKQAFMNIAKGAKRALRKHSPEILTGIGIAGMIATTVTAVRATPKHFSLLTHGKSRRKSVLVRQRWSRPLGSVIFRRR